jgi:putative DNA primase/helicase
MSGTDPIATLLARLDGVKPAGQDKWTAKCPAHDDRSPSLSIGIGDDGRVLVHCFANAACTPEAIVEAVGLTLADLFVDDRSNASRPRIKMPRRLVAAYDYRDEVGTLLYQNVRYEPKDFVARRPDGRGGWVYKLDGVRRVPFRYPELLAAPRGSLILAAEGEKDALALAELGFIATCHKSLGSAKWLPEWSPAIDGQNVVILADNDAPGRDYASNAAHAMHGAATSVRILDLPGLAEHGDAFDWLTMGGDAAQLRALIEAAAHWTPESNVPMPEPATGPRLQLVSLAEVQPREIDWLWPNWLAHGKLHVLAGHPGDGKSTLTTALAALMSTGGRFPDRAFAAQAGTLFLLGEDGIDDTLAPRLLLHGADMTQIDAIRAVQDGDHRQPLDLSKHLHLVRDELQTGRYGLFVVDPLTAFMPRTDRNSEGSVRDVLTPLADVADETHVAVMAVMHLGKGSKDAGRTLLQTILGATAFGAAARVVWLNAEIPDSGNGGPHHRIIQVEKSNIGPKPTPLEWARDIDAPIVWHGESSYTIHDILSGSKTSSLETAVDFLERELAGGMKPQVAVEQAATSEGIKKATLRRAKDHLHIDATRPGGQGPWYWKLPDGSPKGLDAQKSPYTEGEHLASEAPQKLDAQTGNDERLARDAQQELDAQIPSKGSFEHLAPKDEHLAPQRAEPTRTGPDPYRTTCKHCGQPKTKGLPCRTCAASLASA